MMNAYIERFALWLLKLSKSRLQVVSADSLTFPPGTQIVTYPAHMEQYREEITALCDREREQALSTDDILGVGYFRGRRVMSMMKKKYPQLAVRDLWKAVDICSDQGGSHVQA